jgi:uncharacterized membrane protein
MKLKIAHALVFLALAGCSREPEPAPSANDMPSEAGTEAPVPIAAATPPPARPAAPDLPAKFRATGTEPFWGAKVDGNSLSYSTPEYPEGMPVPVTRTVQDGSVTFSGTIDGKPLQLAVSAGPCSDGMSDTVYPWSVTRTIGPDIQRGCARGD